MHSTTKTAIRGLGRVLVPSLTALVLACSSGPDRSGLNVLLITVDTTRADAFDPQGPYAALIPNVVKLAREGVHYTNAHTVAPITLPSHSSMMTGLVPPRHSVHLNGTQSLPDEAVTIAELAKELGYSTSAFIAAVVLNSEYGLAQGFDHYDEIGSVAVGEQMHYAERPAKEVINSALAWFDERPDDDPFFSWLHFFDPHMPYQPPVDALARAGNHPYLGEINYLDSELGRLFAELKRRGAWDDTVVMIVADHGEALFEHDEATHGTFGFESTLRIPMILRDPRSERRGPIDAPTSVVDVHPTLAGVIGADRLPELDGLDLGVADPDASRGLYLESYFGTHSYGWAPMAGWIQDGWKLIQSSESELYHLAVDPGETTNLALESNADAKLRELRRALGQVYTRPKLQAAAAQARPEVLASLQGLGYVGMELAAEEFASPFDESDKPAPHTQIQNLRDFQEASTASELEDFAKAIGLLEPLVARAPGNGAAWRVLATCYINSYRFDDGLVATKRNYEIQGDWWGANVNFGAAYQGLGQMDLAIEHYKKAVEQNPELDRVAVRLGSILIQRPTAEEQAEGYRYLKIVRDNKQRRGEWEQFLKDFESSQTAPTK